MGEASIEKKISDVISEDFKRALGTSLPITLLIMLITFGAVVAALIPVGLALTAVLGTIGLVGLLSHISAVDSSINEVILLIGLAVGVDYSMFYLRREREERERGASEEASLAAAAATSGRAVLVSGFTVIIAMAGMYLAGAPTFESFATGTIIVVAVAVVGSLTVLPALLAWLGDRVEKGGVPIISKMPWNAGESGLWARILNPVLRHPLISVIASAGILVVLAIPAFSLHLAVPGPTSLPQNLKVVKTYNKIQAIFPGDTLPAVVVVRSNDVTSPQVAQAIRMLRERAAASPLFRQPSTLKAIVLNLLSVGAAYGVLVWIFQYGHLESFLDFKSTGSITSWMPLFLFVVLFGLSMDYHVFILSRIREAFDRGSSTEDAVAHGIKSTAGVVTSAAVVMVSVFAIFATLSLLIFKQLGVGLAVAVLIDATLVRGVLLPATMKLLGDWNWYLPKWLEWLPHVGPGDGRGLPPEKPRPRPQAHPADVSR